MEDKYLKKRFHTLKNAEKKPRSAVWNQIEKDLKNEKRFRFQKQFNLGLAASLVIVFSLLIFLQFGTRTVENTKAEEPNTIQYSSPAISDSVDTQDSFSAP